MRTGRIALMLKWTTLLKWTLYIVATLQFLRIYIYNATCYLKLPLYLAGQERLPFQKRILPALLLNLFYKNPWLIKHFNHVQGVFSFNDGPFFVVSLAALVFSYVFLLKLYRAVSPSRLLEVLVYPIFLSSIMLTYSGHLEQNLRYPYDFLAVAFFTAGLYFIYTRRFVSLTLVVFFGTLNRETTLFLIGIFLIDAAFQQSPDWDALLTDERSPRRFWQTIPWGQMPWSKAALLGVIWLTIQLVLAHVFRFNDRKEDFLRFQYNLGLLHLRLIPALLNLCGYMLPVVWFLRKRIRPLRFGAYIYILPVWFLVMFSTGILIEVRIYGELCSYTAIAVVLLLEQHVLDRQAQTPVSHNAAATRSFDHPSGRSSDHRQLVETR